MRPELACLVIKGSANLWIGQICYRDRTMRSMHGWHVDPNTLIDYRVEIARKLMVLTNDYFNNDWRRVISWRGVLSDFIRFIYWCDESIGEEAIRPNLVISSYKRYVKYLIESVQTSKIKSMFAVRVEIYVREVIEAIYELRDIDNGVIKPRNKNDSNPILPPDVYRQSASLAFLNSVFDGAYDLCVNEKYFPFPLELKGIKPEAGTIIWQFPSIKRFLSPNENALTISMRNCNDYLNGRIFSISEIERIRKVARPLAAKAHERAISQLLDHNTDTRSYFRMEHAYRGMAAFKMLFIANTGMNREQALTLKWSDDYTLDRVRSGFKQVKYRAGNKSVYFEIQSIFVKLFKRYITLRSYILGTKSSDFLFLAPSNSITQEVSLKRFSKKVAPALKSVTSREWRAAKSDWLIRNTDVATTAQVLQNSETTVKKHYAEGSYSEHVNEVGSFLESISDRIVAPSFKAKPSAVGACRAPNTPISIAMHNDIKPDCKQPEGCLFCDKFVIHSDDRDIRKLLSCKYCILQSKILCESAAQFETLYGPILDRINNLVSELKSNRDSNDITESIEKDVFENENLDPYWESKVSMIIDLGVM